MRDRLIELLVGADDKVLSIPYVSEDGMIAIADYLLENGVIVPPCKVGDKVYYIYRFNGKKIGEARVVQICRGECGFTYYLNSGYDSYFDLQEEKVFFTIEEAEKSLKGGNK